jgi:DNA-directed RNA polymerase subunit alpha
MSVYDLIHGTGISTRTVNALWRNHIETAGDLAGCAEDDLLDIRNFGPVCVDIVKAALAEHGLALREAP